MWLLHSDLIAFIFGTLIQTSQTPIIFASSFFLIVCVPWCSSLHTHSLVYWVLDLPAIVLDLFIFLRSLSTRFITSYCVSLLA